MAVRPAYRDAVAWVALNDESSLRAPEDAQMVSEMISVALIADLWGKEAWRVATDVMEYRIQEDAGANP